jgi:hypothetical protein
MPAKMASQKTKSRTFLAREKASEKVARRSVRPGFDQGSSDAELGHAEVCRRHGWTVALQLGEVNSARWAKVEARESTERRPPFSIWCGGLERRTFSAEYGYTR